MDTKYQSRIFSGILMVIAIICLGLSFLTSFEKKMNVNEDNISYFHDSPEIGKMAIRYVKNLQRYYIYYRNFDLDEAEKKLSEIETYISTGKIKTNSKDYNFEIRPFVAEENTEEDIDDIEEDTGNVKLAPEEFYNFDISTVTVDTLLEHQKNLTDAISNYQSIKNFLIDSSDFHYVIVDNYTGYMISNSPDYSSEQCYDEISINDPLFNISFNGETLINAFKNAGLSCRLSIPTTTSSNVKMLMTNLHVQLENNKIFSSYIVSGALAGTGVLILLLIYIFEKEFFVYICNKIYRVFCKIPLIVMLPIVVMILGIATGMYIGNLSLITEAILNGHMFRLMLMIAISIFAVLFIALFIGRFIHILKNRKEFSTIPDIVFLMKGINDIRLAAGAGKYFFAFILGLMQSAIVFMSCIIFILLLNFSMFMSIIFWLWGMIAAIVILYNVCAAEVRLRYYIKEMAEGHMEVVPEQMGLFTNSINQLNRIRENFQYNLDETLRSERLKTDLITNVSHDLKTPLTSIINYVELLSTLPNNSEDAKEYIDIIKNKSRRLKTLIDDLFEASKLSSGQMKLNRVDSDIVSLLEQTLGELSYKIEESEIEFVVTNINSPIILNIDGERMWRVFDNLINNILKYSPKKSRAYIDIEENEDNVVIVFKNVANYHMEFNADELFERFKRGDIARTTEGSGLGLSIAKSIVELHGGTMNIVTDGDLFKIVVKLYKEKIEDDENDKNDSL